jgi:hypothetical protein
VKNKVLIEFYRIIDFATYNLPMLIRDLKVPNKIYRLKLLNLIIYKMKITTPMRIGHFRKFITKWKKGTEDRKGESLKVETNINRSK